VERRRTDWLQHIPAIVGGIIFVMSMVVIIIIATMWSDLTKPGMEAQQEHTRQLEIYERTAQTLANIDARVQKIESQEPGSGTKAPN